MSNYAVRSVNGPVVTVSGAHDLAVYDMVFVGEQRLIGEVVGQKNNSAVVQVYEETGGLHPGMPVYTSGAPMSVTLGPGLLRGIFDGIARPLDVIAQKAGPFITRGANVDTLDTSRTFDVSITIHVGDTLAPGQVYAEIQETPAIRHYIMASPNSSGTVVSVKPNGAYHVNDTIVTITTKSGDNQELTLCQKWPIRISRPCAGRLPVNQPLITGQRVIDSLFPIAKGGAAAIPGPFGAGKTITQHQLAKWSDADIIVYIGCGERGNEMTQVLEEFSELTDPKSGLPLRDRTILIANTSNMPVASREASIYTGITIAEYYRDMGYHVAIMADSTSRWAEALREISGRLEEMPAEEGFPAYLPSRLASFYERSGFFNTLCGKNGSITIIGAVSPQGSDFSEPVTQNTKRFTRTFWALDRSLSYARHFPSINWITSYSEYLDELEPWYEKNLGRDFSELRSRITTLLQEESSLMEIAKLIGTDILPDDQKLVIEIARIVRIGFLQQNAYHNIDTFTSLQKQKFMMQLFLHCYDRAQELLPKSIPISQLKQTGIFDELIKVKYDIPNDKPGDFDAYFDKIDEIVDNILQSNQA